MCFFAELLHANVKSWPLQRAQPWKVLISSSQSCSTLPISANMISIPHTHAHRGWYADGNPDTFKATSTCVEYFTRDFGTLHSTALVLGQPGTRAVCKESLKEVWASSKSCFSSGSVGFGISAHQGSVLIELRRKLCFMWSSVEKLCCWILPPPATSGFYFSASLQCCSTTQ